MTDMKSIKEHMEVIGADGVHVGTVDRVERNRIKLTKADSGEGRHKGHHHYIDGILWLTLEGNKVRLSAKGDVAMTMEREGLSYNVMKVSRMDQSGHAVFLGAARAHFEACKKHLVD